MLLTNPLGRLTTSLLGHGKGSFAHIRHWNQIRIVVVLVMGGRRIIAHRGGQSVQQVRGLSMDSLRNNYRLLAAVVDAGSRYASQRPALSRRLDIQYAARPGHCGQAQHDV